MTIVSFFATPPTKSGFPTTDYDKQDGSIDPSFLPGVWARLKKRATPTGKLAPTTDVKTLPSHMMVRVASVSEIGEWLSSYWTLGTSSKPVPKLRIQLIGHSLSGQLSLGGGWKPDAAKWEPPFYWFDSNPRALAPLALPDLIDEVMLAGCYIAQRLTNLNAVNGPTLLFALSQLWRCHARGAVTSVNPEDFDDNGWYRGVDGARPTGWRWKKTATSASTSRELRWSPTHAKLPAPSAITTAHHELTNQRAIAELCGYFDAVLPKDHHPRAVLPDVAMTFDYNKTRVPAYLVSNATLLVVGNGKSRKVYANFERRPSAHVAHLVDHLMTRR